MPTFAITAAWQVGAIVAGAMVIIMVVIQVVKGEFKS